MKILVTVPFQKEHQEELKKAAPDALIKEMRNYIMLF